MTKQPVVYIMSSRRNGTLYTGVTSDLAKRVWEHRGNFVEGFTKRYGVHTLVWFELHSEMYQAIVREKQIKKWNRAWKIKLIEQTNPQWRDLWPSLTGNNDLGSQPPSTFETQADVAVLDSRLRGNDGEGYEQDFR
ncbi:MAG: GIY-YIG nuclease family protein [Candidatus Competibacteraceae bacterium]|uniref:Excinuclease ABC C subunit domain protein (Modular protein) n=1 Tax=Candidatus Contendobacter odensis Run_B_J11 TaxID=1400861 RepID=A0A7U7J359_9GAMM|nr:GIY-YIG nuclease family protein [Candidatus Contendobacter odensis]MBK8538030.1 GIY-YIG nuclease family protein [Candidatus Competibacteraceae bacterium]CDH44234.1 Excinuclease ABC C subunit domain protein (modular protein) [Candidatus Contendobacter odensis Run_B_J11]